MKDLEKLFLVSEYAFWAETLYSKHQSMSHICKYEADQCLGRRKTALKNMKL